MTRPVQITFRNMAVSAVLEEEIRSRVAWLDTFHPGIISCRVVVDVPHKHRRRGRPLHVRIELSLPGEDVIVDHKPELRPADGDTPRKSDEPDRNHTGYVALHEAFDIARRRLEDIARCQRGDVKTVLT